MKRSKKIRHQVKIQKHHQVPAGTPLPGLVALFRNAGLVDDQGRPTEEGQKAIDGIGKEKIRQEAA